MKCTGLPRRTDLAGGVLGSGCGASIAAYGVPIDDGQDDGGDADTAQDGGLDASEVMGSPVGAGREPPAGDPPGEDVKGRVNLTVAQRRILCRFRNSHP